MTPPKGWIRSPFEGILAPVQGLAIVIVVATAIGAPENAPKDARAAVKRAEDAFSFRDFASVVQTLDPWLHPPRILDEALLVEARKLMGVSLAGLDREREAREEFGQLLLLDPDHQLDAFVVPPNIIAIFEAVREEMKDTLAELSGKEKPPPNEATITPELRLELVEVPPRWMMFLPGGLPQFALSQSGWGAMWLSVQITAVILNVVAYRAGTGLDSSGNQARGLLALQYIGLGALAGTWAGSAIHGLAQLDELRAALEIRREQAAAGPTMTIGFRW